MPPLKTPRYSITELVAAVRKYAELHYTRDGWDYVVECWTDDDIRETIEHVAHTPANAIRACHSICIVQHGARQDAIAAGDGSISWA